MNWFKKQMNGLSVLIKDLLSQGLTKRQVTLALVVGISIGCMPLVWGTSVLCMFLAYVLRLNQVLVQLANYLVYPLQILLFIPFLKAGGWLFVSSSGRDLQAGAAFSLLKSAPGQFFHQFWLLNLQALVVWLITLPLLACILYFAISYRINKQHSSTAG